MSLDKEFKHSDFLASASFEADNEDNTVGQLTVRLKNGKIYNYYSVPLGLWDKFIIEKNANIIFRDVLDKYKVQRSKQIFIDADLENIYSEVIMNEMCNVFLFKWKDIYNLIHSFDIKELNSVFLTKDITFSFKRDLTKFKRNRTYNYVLFVRDESGYCNMLDIFCESAADKYKFKYKLNNNEINNFIIDKVKNIDNVEDKIISIIKKDALFK